MTANEIKTAREAHESWIASLSPEELREAKSLGIAEFSDPSSTAHSFEYIEGAEANSTAAGDRIDKIAEETGRSRAEIVEILSLAGNSGQSSENGEQLREILSIIFASGNPRLTSAALMLVSGLAAGAGFSSAQQVADELQESKQVLSKEVARIRGIFGDISLVFSRKPEARKAYSRAQAENHWRRRSSAQALANFKQEARVEKADAAAKPALLKKTVIAVRRVRK